MKKKAWILIVSVGFLIGAGIMALQFLGYFSRGDKTGKAEEALSKALHSYENWSSFQGEAQLTQYNNGGNPITDIIAVEIVQPLKVKVTFKASDDPTRVGLTVISDGEKIYEINPANLTHNESNIPGFAQNLDLIPQTLADVKPDETYDHPLVLLISNPIMEYVFPVGFAQGISRFDHQFLGEEAVADRRTWKIQFHTETDSCLAWIDQDTGVILKYSQKSGEQKVIEMEFLSVEFDGGIDAREFSPPSAESTPTTSSQGADASSLSVTVSGSAADQLVEELNARAIAKLQVGWVHIQENVSSDTDRENKGILPNGMAIPNQQVNDIWYHFDHGLVSEGVTIMHTTDGHIVQVGINSNGTSWNSGTDETKPFEPFYITGFDCGFLKNDLQWLESFGNEATISPTTLPSGGRGVQITIGDEFDQPVTTNDYIQPSTRAETRAVFDSATGYLVSREVVIWFADGSQRVFSSMTQEIAFESPTEEVLKYLSEKGQGQNMR